MGSVVTSRVVDAEWLRSRLTDPGVVVIEVTNTPGAAPGGTLGEAGGAPSVPGARTVYWKDLLWHRTRREFAAPHELAARLHALGADAESTVIFAGEPTQFAAYALWVAAAVGVGGDLRYLDGGLPAWRGDGRAPVPSRPSAAEPPEAIPSAAEPPAPVSPADPSRAPSAPPLPLVAPRTDELVAGREDVLAAIASPTAIVDLRSPEEYSGARVAPVTEPIDHGAERGGHIPGASSLPVQDLLDEQGLLRPVAEIRARVAALGIDAATEIIAYCRLSHRAALGWLIFEELLGDRRVRVYDGSWTEWGSLVGAPIEV